MITIKEWVYKTAALLKENNHCQFSSSPIKEARLILGFVLSWEYEQVFFNDSTVLSKEHQREADLLVNRRLNDEPLSKIVQRREFWRHSFKVTDKTLDPRSDSETLIEAVLELYPNQQDSLKILDLGTGTGCLIISLLLEYPQALGVGVDICENALEIARDNCLYHCLADRLILKKSNWFDLIEGQFDIILSNPPYISIDEPLPAAVYKYDPHQALFAEKNGLAAYEIIAQQGQAFLTETGVVIVEIGFGQKKQVIDIFEHNQLFYCFDKNDLSHIPRCLVFCRKKTLEIINKN